MKRFYTRLELQALLEADPVAAEVSYMDREATAGEPGDNWIVYYLALPSAQVLADDTMHMRSVGVEIIHFHKRKLDSIAKTIGLNFSAPISLDSLKQPRTDYFGTYYTINILTGWDW